MKTEPWFEYKYLKLSLYDMWKHRSKKNSIEDYSSGKTLYSGQFVIVQWAGEGSGQKNAMSRQKK